MSSTMSHKNSRNRSSLTRSSSVSKEPLLTNVEEESEDQVFSDSITSNIRYGFYSKSFRNPGDVTMGETHTETPYNRREFSRREILKAKLKYHFMNPWRKYKARKRKPWKLLIQIFKIIIVTVQVGLFGNDRFSVVQFAEENHQALQYLFLKDYNGEADNAAIVYTRDEVYSYLHYAHEQYYNIFDAVGSYDYESKDADGNPPHVVLCYRRFKNFTVGSKDNLLVFVPDTVSECQKLPKPIENKHYIKNDSFQFGMLLNLNLSFTLNAINLRGVKSWDKPACYSLKVTINFDNTKLDGQMPISLDMENSWLKCEDDSEIKTSDEEVGHLIAIAFLVFGVIVIVISTLSLILCLRSLYKSIHLAKEARLYFEEEQHNPLTLSETMELFNLWFIVIIVADLLTILGCTYKIAIEQRDGDYYDVCSVLFGLAVLLVWCGLLRFLQYFKQYNTLLVTIKAAGPSVLRFCVCSGVLFVGFTLCGWIVLGPYHPKFRDTTVTAECLYSLVNGDDMFNTYALVNPKNQAIWIYSKLYLYIFISLFIYVVLSLFIGIIGDTYERLKDMGQLPASRLQTFLEENHRETRQAGNATQSSANENNTAILVSSTTTNDSMYRRVSMESTGVE
ncbi:mucolipin-3-like isoform X1 [Actinia tenebrosa]|uniref:Mucolipin-3-like isoform X1 n=1 Tax=Actinia tenebrosa TaxID=6105 RepID=A0A6P8HIH5_ACTTE|nr:mucolipin-3-like isoform X1 [Actinia tenebrosa]